MATRKTATKRTASRTAAAKPSGNGKKPVFTDRDIMALSAVARSIVSQRMGLQYGGDRDLVAALGRKTKPDFKDFMAKYRRNGIATAVVKRVVDKCWDKPPVLTESEDDETAFEREFEAIAKRLNLWHHMKRADRLARIGSYSVLLIGFQDGAELSQEVVAGRDVAFVRAYSHGNVEIQRTITSINDPRFGKPEVYKIKMKQAGGTGTITTPVHWSRVIHIAEDLLEDENEGMPQLEDIYDNLEDIEKIVGGSGEMFWRAGMPGLGAIAREGYDFDTDSKEELREEMQNYWHGLSRIMRLAGVDLEQLAPDVANPRHHFDIQLDVIAAAKGIPKRVLIGTEEAKLAGSQDERNFNTSMMSRQSDFCDRVMVRPFADRLIEKQVLTAPAKANGYEVEWPPLSEPTTRETAEVGESRAKALKTVAEAYTLGGRDFLPLLMVMEKVLGLRKDEIEQAQEMADAEAEEERRLGTAEPVEEDEEE